MSARQIPSQNKNKQTTCSNENSTLKAQYLQTKNTQKYSKIHSKNTPKREPCTLQTPSQEQAKNKPRTSQKQAKNTALTFLSPPRRQIPLDVSASDQMLNKTKTISYENKPQHEQRESNKRKRILTRVPTA
jgi:hypothetical protein